MRDRVKLGLVKGWMNNCKEEGLCYYPNFWWYISRLNKLFYDDEDHDKAQYFLE